MEREASAAFGDLLKAYRLAAGLTQEALAERAGVSARSIQNLERGENRPFRDTARRLAEALPLSERDRALLLAAVIPMPRRRTATPPATDQAAFQPPAEPEAPLPGGMLAVLVADVRGYTAYTHQHGDAAGAALAMRFAALAGEAVAAEGGRVVEVRGDEVLAVFTSARAALRAATGLLARCAEAATDDLPLRAGVGLDVGEPVPVPGGYRGEVINVAARLCAQAGPGEVLASEAAVGLARRVEGLAYQERGELALKGLARPVRAWVVQSGRGEQAPVEAVAALAAHTALTVAAPTPRHNLPVSLSSLIGREAEQGKVVALLAEARLVTLTGSGGVGKTRLALAAAASVLDAYPDGVWLVDLTAVHDPALVPSAVIATLKLRDEPGRPPLDTLIDGLRAKHALLVLDNCEHLVAACAVVADALLHSCRALRVLATSQEALALVGERLFRVPSLSVPDPHHLPPTEMVSSYEAVRLFVARAQDRQITFALTQANAPAVAEICARLDGIPLAIELAAARVTSLPVEAIAARLDDRFHLLTRGSRAALPRQQTLRAALDWSYELLDAREQTMLRRVAVFEAGGWTWQAAAAICAGDGIDEWDVLDLLDALANKSLVLAEPSTRTPSEELRYRLLETVRHYGREKLAAGGELALARERHCAYYLALAEEAEPALIGPEQARWLARLEAEHDNLRAALTWSIVAGGRPEAGLALAGLLWRFWSILGHLREGRAWLERALAAAGTSAGPAALARAFNGAGNLAQAQGDLDQASALHRQSLAIRRELRDARGIAASLANLGNIAWLQARYDQASALIEESLAVQRSLGDTWGTAASLHSLAGIYFDQGAYARAAALYEETLTLHRALGDTSGIGFALTGMGTVAARQGQYERAAALHGESLILYRDLGDKGMTAWIMEEMAMAASDEGRHERAARLFGAAEALREAVGRSLEPSDRALRDRAFAMSQRALGDAAFAALHAEGRALPHGHAVAFALERPQCQLGGQ